MSPSGGQVRALAGTPLAVAVLAATAGAAPAQDGSPDTAQLAPIVVTATRSPVPLPELPGNATRIDGQTVDRVEPTHPSELLARVPGVLVNRGSGQEHLLGIRSPVLTGGGACGSFLLLENGVPIRPAGLCNVNGLFELNLAQADAVEVVRGPGSVLYGANALHGMVNALAADPGRRSSNRASVMAGGDDYRRGSFDLGGARDGTGFRVLGHAEHDDDNREQAFYDQQKLNAAVARASRAGRLTVNLAATNLNQETGGYILGEDAYRDDSLNRTNPNPEAYRDTRSARLTAHWEPAGSDSDWRFYARHSRMDFLQHFLPGNPLELNGQDSAGVLYSRSWNLSDRTGVTAGADLEYADIFLTEIQDAALDGPPDFSAIRPAGRHYDFTVNSLMGAAYFQARHEPARDWQLTAGLRLEGLRYEYDNRLPDGNSRDDGSECGFGGCLFNRPADRTDEFGNLSPRLGVVRRLGGSGAWYASLSRGYRPPQVTELYRLQRGQAAADLDEVRLDALETGVRGRRGDLGYDLALYAMRKSDVIFRDSSGFNVSGARTRHRGLEAAVEWEILNWLTLNAGGSYARHTYDSTHELDNGVTVREGNTVDTAPRLLADARLVGRGPSGLVAELEAVHVDEYWLDEANEHRYGGHTLFNLRGAVDLSDHARVSLIVTNLADRAYAERADYAFGNYRYFPGRPRSAYVQFTARF